MANKVSMSVIKRENAGKGAARAIRREGLIPAVIYGNKAAAELISVEPKEMLKQMKIKGFKTRQFDLDLDGKKELALCQSIQYDKVKDTPIHIDFLRIDANKEIAIDIPFVFVGEDKSPAIKSGGVLNIVARSASVICKPADIVDGIEIDVSKLDGAEAIHSTDVALPKGLKFEDHEVFTICTVVMAVEEVVETAAPTASEVPTGGDLKKAEADKKAEEEKSSKK